MLRTRNLLLIFIPAFFFVGIGLFIRIVQYKPLYPDAPLENDDQQEFVIPIFPNDPILGNKKAPKTIIAFEDFGCAHCKELSESIDQVMASYPNQVKVVWKGLPVTRFPHNTRDAHHYAYCANQQGQFAEFASFAFANYQNLSPNILQTILSQLDVDEDAFTACLATEAPEQSVLQTEQTARTLNIQSVPAIFINNKQVQPPSTVQEWERVLGLN